MLKSFRYLLFPFSILYSIIINIRNWLFDKKILSSTTFNFPLICVGNIAVGGTGKTPMVEYIITFFKDRYKTATLSRGYKRKTRGFAIANNQSTAIEIGDEPMQLFRKYPDVIVSVGEERIIAIPQLLQENPETQVIVLDDAFQHRAILAGLNILLTDFSNLFTRDHILPMGDRRDVKASSKRAELIVVTKCPKDMDVQEKESIEKEINKSTNQKIFFTSLEYGMPYRILTDERKEITSDMYVLLLCGIANPAPLKEFLNNNVYGYDMLRYRDHHIFSTDDLREIKKQFESISSPNKIILTTEKDAIRLEKFNNDLRDLPIYIIPVRHHFLFEQGSFFNSILNDFVTQYYK